MAPDLQRVANHRQLQGQARIRDSLMLSGLVSRTPPHILKGKQEGDGLVVTRSDNGVA